MKDLVSQYPNIKLLLAGNGPERENLEMLILDNDLEKRVTMLGYVTNLQEYQQIADVSVTCSKREGLPLNVVEAMLSGTPVVATKNRGHRELICDGKNGFLIEVDDYHSLSKRILTLLADNKVYERIQTSAQNYAQSYTFDNVKRELTKVYGLKDE